MIVYVASLPITKPGPRVFCKATKKLLEGPFAFDSAFFCWPTLVRLGLISGRFGIFLSPTILWRLLELFSFAGDTKHVHRARSKQFIAVL